MGSWQAHVAWFMHASKSPMKPDLIRIGIADDHALVRVGLRQLFTPRHGFDLVGEAADGHAALEMVRTTRPDVLLMDLAMRPLNGLEAITRIHASAPALGILVFSGYPAATYADRLRQQGASGYVDKGSDPDELVQAVRKVAAGGRHFGVAVPPVPAPVVTQVPAALHETLTRREFQIFLRLAGGLSVGAIARSICVSPRTVSTYSRRLRHKMGLNTSSELMRYALSHGLLD